MKKITTLLTLASFLAVFLLPVLGVINAAEAKSKLDQLTKKNSQPLLINYQLSEPSTSSNLTAAVSNGAEAHVLRYCSAPKTMNTVKNLLKKWPAGQTVRLESPGLNGFDVSSKTELLAAVNYYHNYPNATVNIIYQERIIVVLTPQDSIQPKERCQWLRLPQPDPIEPDPIIQPIPETKAMYYLDESIYKPQRSPEGFPWLIGDTKGYVAARSDGSGAMKLDAYAVKWEKMALTSISASYGDMILNLCQQNFGKTYVAVNMNNYNYNKAWLKYLRAPKGYQTYACLTPPTNVSGAQIPETALGGVLMWYGKVNKYSQDIETSSADDYSWVNDPDGKSGANIDVVKYCRKWYPETKSAYLAGISLASDWRNRGLTGSYEGTGNLYVCSSEPRTTNITTNTSVSSKPSISPSSTSVSNRINVSTAVTLKPATGHDQNEMNISNNNEIDVVTKPATIYSSLGSMLKLDY